MSATTAAALADDLEAMGCRLAAWLAADASSSSMGTVGVPVSQVARSASFAGLESSVPSVPSAPADMSGQRASPASAGHCELKPATGGFSNQTCVGTWHPPGAASIPIVLRLQSATPTVFPDPSIDRQVRVMQALAGTAVPVPRLLGREEGADVLGAPFVVMQRVPGRVPQENPLYHLEGWFHDLDSEVQRRHWFSGIDTLAAIAQVDWLAGGLDFLAPPPGVSVLEQQFQTWTHMLQWVEAGAHPYPHLHTALAWLRHHSPPAGPVSLSWGDAKLGNCVFNAQGRVAAALDWEQATLSHPVDDLAWWLMLDECLSDGYGVPRLSGLPTRQETVAHWERASGLRADDLPFYEVFTAWRMALIMARIGTLFTQRGWVDAQAQMDVRNGAATLLTRHAQRLGF
jgi:aminoglycoside phosphotransferase (APT) family kinase protein